MSVECPYCNNIFNPEDQFDEGVGQDERVEILCDNKKCQKIFTAVAYYSLDFGSEQQEPELNKDTP